MQEEKKKRERKREAERGEREREESRHACRSSLDTFFDDIARSSWLCLRISLRCTELNGLLGRLEGREEAKRASKRAVQGNIGRSEFTRAWLFQFHLSLSLSRSLTAFFFFFPLFLSNNQTQTKRTLPFLDTQVDSELQYLSALKE